MEGTAFRYEELKIRTFVFQFLGLLHTAPVDGPVAGGHDEHAGAEAEQRGGVEGVGQGQAPGGAAAPRPGGVEAVRLEVELVVAASAA